MRKGTKKNIIHGILIIFVIIFALMASLIAAFRDVTVQSMIARSIAGELSKKLNADIKIKTFFITDQLSLCIEDVMVNDLDGYPMFLVGRLDAKISPMIMFNEIIIKEIYLKDVLGRIVKYEGNDAINIKELFSQLGDGDKKENNDNASDLRIKVEKMRLDNGHVIFWNQDKDKPEKLSMDYAHIDIDSIYAVVSDIEIRQDSVLGNVHTLKGKDKCGLVLEEARGDVLFCEKCLNIDNLIIETGVSHADLDLRFEHNRSKAYFDFVDSVRIIGKIRPTTLKLSDLRYFAWILDKMPDTFNFTAYFDGPVSDFTISDFIADFGNESHIDADVSFAGLPNFFGTYMDVTIRELQSSYDDTKNFAIPIDTETVPVPEMLQSIGKYSLSGSYQGFAHDFRTQFNLGTEIGDVDAEIYLNTTENPAYSFDIDANQLNIKDLLALKDNCETSFELDMNGIGLDVKETEFEADLLFKSLILKGNEFKDVLIHGDFEKQRLIAITDVTHPYLNLDLSTMVDLSGIKPSYNIKTRIGKADLVNLHLLDNDSIMLFSTDIDMAFSGDDIDNITGSLEMNDTRYFNGEEYLMDNFSANVSEISGIKDVTMDCDFFDFYGTGIVHLKTFVNAMKNTAKRYMNMPGWFENTVPDTNKQEFSLSMDLKDTRTLMKLFAPSLYISSGTTINASYTDGYSYHGSTIESPEVHFNGLKFKNIDIRNTAKFDDFLSKVSVEDIIFRDTTDNDPDPIGLENVVLLMKVGDNKADFNLFWNDDDTDDHNKARIKSTFVPHEKGGGLLSIKSDEILINDTLWRVDPRCNIDFQRFKTCFNDVTLYTGSQKLSVHGLYPTHDSDTLYAEFYNVDISDFDFVTKSSDIDFDGKINGFVGLSGLNENLSFTSDINMDDVYLNGQDVGNVMAKAVWQDPDESIFVNMEIYNDMFGIDKHESVGLAGYYYPKRNVNNIRFDLLFDEFKLETVSPFISNVVKRMNGYASGNINIRGSINNPVILGSVDFNNAGCQINYLNTYYTFDNSIKFKRDKIIFENVIINDTVGNQATVNGEIRHDHLRDFEFDLRLDCNDFLALDIPADNAEGFYGTAVADGTVLVNGTANDIKMSINALTKKGTVIDIPLSGTSSVDNNFIVFVNRGEESDTLTKEYEPEVVKNDRSFSMDLKAMVNSDAAVNIFLPQNMGSINARGFGNINIGLNPNDFELRGDYYITSGTFNFTLEMVKRTFALRRGGSIRWTGDPTDADINVVGVYRTKSSLTSLGTSLVDSTALTNNINVDCIIRLSNKLMNPTITFGIELPNAKEDTKNLVYSVIDTTNQAVMAQQVFSLMVLGSFSYTAGNNISRFGTTAGYSVITNQLSNWLSQISNDFDIGINYTPNDKLTNEELEVALSTQLFDDRLIIEGNFGVIRGNKSDANNANNIVGDVDLTFRLTKRLRLKAYNHTNIKNNYYYYSFENYSDFTQGVGISFSQSFDNIREVFTIHKKNKNKKSKLSDESVPK